jgi:hypothetical protein
MMDISTRFFLVVANMSAADEKPEAFSTSLYVTDKVAYEECKRLLKLQGRSLSEEIMAFIIRRRDQLKGNGSSTESSGRMFDQLKGEHFQLGQKIDKLRNVLDDKKVFYQYRDDFGKVLGYNPGEDVWSGRECARVVEKFLRQSTDDTYRKAATRFLLANRSSLAHTFLDLLESYQEQMRIERKLLELRTDPEELARLDEVERQAEEQRKKESELRKQAEIEEAQRQKIEREKEKSWEEDDTEEEDVAEESHEEEDFEEEAVEGPVVPVPIEEKPPCTAIVPVLTEKREVEEE